MIKNSRVIQILVVILIAYSCVVFAIPMAKNTVFWISYFFDVLSVSLQIYIHRVSFKNNSSARNRFYGLPIAKLGFVYVLLQLLFGLAVSVLSASVPVVVCVLLEVVLLCVMAAWMITAESVRNEIEVLDTTATININWHKETSVKLGSFSSMIDETDIKRDIDRLKEQLQYSDPVSSESTREIETEISEIIADIGNSIYVRNQPSHKICD